MNKDIPLQFCSRFNDTDDGEPSPKNLVTATP